MEQKHTRYQEREIKATEVGSSVPGRTLGDRTWSELGPGSPKTYSWGRAYKGRFYSSDVKTRNLNPTLNLETTNV